MFNSLSGTLTHKMSQTIHLDTQGIEWDITVSDSSLDVFPSVGTQCRIFTWMYHREDSMKLYGFSSNEERTIFLDLLKVDGIGPKAAIKILSSISAERLTQALDTEDMAVLEHISGIGKKTAQKMILTLKGKLAISSDTGRTIKAVNDWQDLIEALVDMGYDKTRIQDAINKIVPSLDSATSREEKETQLFRKVIIALAGS